MNNKCNAFFAIYGENFLRIVIGAIFLMKGFGKLFGEPGVVGFSGWLESLGFPIPVVLGVLVGVLELVGGLFLIVGVWTRESATALAVIILVALIVVRLPQGWAASEADIVLFAALTFYMGFLPKKSIAGIFMKKKSHTRSVKKK
jgi:putative oxidoreductase